jgi:2-phospho-L-lactate guanylyltransferase
LQRVALIPIRDFEGMTRLASVLQPHQRRDLSRSLADVAVSTATAASMNPRVLTSDPAVTAWAAQCGVHVLIDAGGGLSAAVASGIAELTEGEWMVMHGDLPLVTATALTQLADAASRHRFALAPSLDGGTNVIAGSGPFPFSYGPGSFHRHLASVPSAAVVSSPALSVEIDTEMHLRSLGSHRLPSSIRS